MQLDLNCDLGEGCPFDAELMPLITSASVACGFHAGDATMALTALRTAAAHGVRVGAHPSFNDREHFGRRELDVSREQIYAECVYQIGALAGLAAPSDCSCNTSSPTAACTTGRAARMPTPSR